MDYTAQGQTVGLAQRIEQMAGPHGICLSEATARLASGFVDSRDLGAATVKGASDPIHIFELTGLGKSRTRLDVARGRGLTRFVGRDTDLEMLDAALDQARGGGGQVVGVVAEAGTGKSRLCFEFVERCRAKGISVNEGHCPAHGKSVAYLPVLELLRDVFGIQDRDSDHEARRKIAGELVLLDERFQELLPLLFDFLGVPDPERPAPTMSPEARQRQLSAFLRHLTEARSQSELRVLLLDDAHWIDPGSDAFLAQAVEAASGTRTLWLVNFRPEYHADWMSKSYYRQLPLLPLGREATHELLAGLLGRDPSLTGLADKVHERTRGNPFFIEEVAQSLIESGVLEGSRGAYRLVAPIEALEIPGAVQAVLAARIDRLHEREKRLLQTASVIGKELRETILKRIAALPEPDLAGSLAKLVQGEFLFERTLYPEAEYAFKHPLTHEVAYASQLADRRARTHAAVARAIEEVSGDRIEEQAALLAHHWEQAGDAAMAAHWHARAARSCELDNVEDAHRHWSSVRALLRDVPASPEATSLQLEAAIARLHFGLRLGLGHEEAKAILAEGRALAARSGDLRAHAQLLHRFAAVIGNSIGIPTSMQDATEESMELAKRLGDPELRFDVCEAMIDFLHFTGRLRDATQLCNEWLEFGHSHLQPGAILSGIPKVWLFGHRAWIESLMGQFDVAVASLRCFEEETRSGPTTETEGWTECVWAHNRAWAGDAGGALTHARRAVDAAEKYGSNIMRVWAYHHLGVALSLQGEWEAAVENLEFALRTDREMQCWLVIEAEILSHLAEARLGAGDAALARRTAEEAIETGRHRKTPVWEAQAHLILARIILDQLGAGGKKEIENALASCLALVEETEARMYEPHVNELRSRLARLLGDEAMHARALREAHRLFSAQGATGHAERVAKNLSS
jgi:adenylate cyclase